MEVLLFDEDENLAHLGRCKIAINMINKHLIVKSNNDDSTIVQASFEENCIQLKNMLFVICSNENNKTSAFILVFSSEDSSKKVFEAVQKGKNSPLQIETRELDDLLETKFFLPLVVVMEKNNLIESKNIFIILLEKFAHDRKKKCLYILKRRCENFYGEIAKNFDDFIGDDINNPRKCIKRNSRKRAIRETSIQDKEKGSDSEFSSSYLDSSEESDSICSDNDFESFDEDKISSPANKRGRNYTINGQIIESPNYELLKFELDDRIMSRLFIFPISGNRNLCYDYACRGSENKYFLCCGCRHLKNKTATAVLLKHSNGGKEYIQLSENKHICNLVKYEPEKYRVVPSKQIVKAPNFKLHLFMQDGINRRSLFIFTSLDQKLGYEYHWNNSKKNFRCSECRKTNKSVTAKMGQNADDGEEYIKLNKAEHICQEKEYQPEKYKNDIILYKPDYQIVEQTVYGITKKRLLTIVQENRDLCYEFNKNIQYETFICYKCSNKGNSIRAHICNDSKANEYVSLQDRQHICEPVPYALEKYETRKIVRKPNFQVLKRKYRGRLVEKLIIFIDETKELCYEYTLHGDKRFHNFFYCWICQKTKKVGVYAKLIQIENEEEYVELSKNEHECEPLKFKPENLNIKIVKQPNYKLEEYQVNYNGERHVRFRLIIFDSKDKTRYYRYGYKNDKKLYACNECSRKSKYVTAKIKQDENGEDYLVLNDTEHVCEPCIYEAPLTFLKVAKK